MKPITCVINERKEVQKFLCVDKNKSCDCFFTIGDKYNLIVLKNNDIIMETYIGQSVRKTVKLTHHFLNIHLIIKHKLIWHEKLSCKNAHECCICWSGMKWTGEGFSRYNIHCEKVYQ